MKVKAIGERSMSEHRAIVEARAMNKMRRALSAYRADHWGRMPAGRDCPCRACRWSGITAQQASRAKGPK